MKNTLHALNIHHFLEIKQEDLDKNVVLAIDASTGPDTFLGNISIKSDSISLGSGLNKNLTTIGDISIAGITAIYRKNLLDLSINDMKKWILNSEKMDLLCHMTSDFVAQALHLSKRR